VKPRRDREGAVNATDAGDAGRSLTGAARL
jgi:hypothetical protein